MKQRASFWVLFLSLWFSGLAMAAADNPVEMLESVTAEVLAQLKSHKTDFDAHPDQLQDMMDRIMLPHVDLDGMARWVVGRTAWIKATPDQQTRFTQQFRHLIINTYAGALSSYRNQTIEYLPVRGGIANKDRVQVTSRIHEPGKESLEVIYRLVKKPDGWKVYDIVIEGVSLLKGFQAQFADDIQQKDFDVVIRNLTKHNQRIQGKTVQADKP